MKSCFVTTLAAGLLSLSGPVVALPWLLPCTTATYASPAPNPNGAEGPVQVAVPVNTIGCKKGVVLRVDAITTLWRCEVELADGVEPTEGQPMFGFLIKRGDAPLQILPDEVMAGALGNFDVIKVDLDNDGTRENILAAWNSQSNGIGTHFWTVTVFDANWSLLTRFEDVNDWGRSNLAKAAASRRGCDIAITSLEPVNPDSGALVLRARLYRAERVSTAPQTGALNLVVARDRPSLERRYTRAFEAQRTAWFSQGDNQWRGNIAAWLNNRATRAKPFSP